MVLCSSLHRVVLAGALLAYLALPLPFVLLDHELGLLTGNPAHTMLDDHAWLDHPAESGLASGDAGIAAIDLIAWEALPPVLRVQREDPSPLWVDVDARTGEILEMLDPSRRTYHRLFELLHRWDAPWFSGHEDIRRIGMAGWCGLGAGFALSGLWIWATRPSVSKGAR